MITNKVVEIEIGCPVCAGLGIIPHRHITNKRNKKTCPRCEGKGEVQHRALAAFDTKAERMLHIIGLLNYNPQLTR